MAGIKEELGLYLGGGSQSVSDDRLQRWAVRGSVHQEPPQPLPGC